ncbi:MAG TPA: hypothetical protein VF211_02825 [Burkholderiales bacterium]
MAAPSEEELARYRAALAELMARCLERVRAFPLPDDAEPLEPWRPHEE